MTEREISVTIIDAAERLGISTAEYARRINEVTPEQIKAFHASRAEKSQGRTADEWRQMYEAMKLERDNERERCATIALDERVDYAATGDPTDESYNAACIHIAERIRTGQ